MIVQNQKKASNLANGVGHSTGWITVLEGVVWRFHIKFVINDKSLIVKITILSEIGNRIPTEYYKKKYSLQKTFNTLNSLTNKLHKPYIRFDTLKLTVLRNNNCENW